MATQSHSKNQKITKTQALMRDAFSIFAQMLAVENIKIVFTDQLSAPANFDLVSRVLKIAPLEEDQTFLIPGLTIHEVGHALFSTLTPDEQSKLQSITKVLNIIEDGYQERMMCKKFIGAKKHLYTIFEHFFLKDMSIYDNENKVIEILNILNHNCKGEKHGYYLNYPSYVNAEDIELLKNAETTILPTIIKRNDLANQVIAMLKKYGTANMSGDSLFSSEENKGNDGTSDSSSDLSGSKEPQELTDEEKSELDEWLEETVGDGLFDHHQKLKTITKTSGGGNKVAFIPSLHEILKIAEIRELGQKEYSLEKDTSAVRVQKKEFLSRARIYASSFLTKANANNYIKTSEFKTGMLDSDSLALYKVKDDIFRRETIEPNQVSHAFVVMVDWSSSMNSTVSKLVKLLSELLYFAKFVNVELEVWLYTTSHGKNVSGQLTRSVVFNESLFGYVASSKKPLAIENAISALLSKNAKAMPMGGTNNQEALLFGHERLSAMKADKKVCMLLTDGDDSGATRIIDPSSSEAYHSHMKSGDVVYANGVSLGTIPEGYSRTSLTENICMHYRSQGQKTIGIGWDMTDSSSGFLALKRISDSVINIDTSEDKPKSITENKFVQELIKNIT